MMGIEVFVPKVPDRISFKSALIGLFSFLFFCLLAILIEGVFNQIVWAIFLSAITAYLTTIQVESYFRHQAALMESTKSIHEKLSKQEVRQQADYQQLEALFSVFSLIKPRQPLPPMREWAISPDFACLLIRVLYNYRPSVVLETGCGVSTLIAAYCLDTIGVGQIFSLEHDKYYAEACQTQVDQHCLKDRATILYSPLKTITLDQTTWNWYDTEFLQELHQGVDLLCIDGPPGGLQHMARYPALPVLFQYLSDGAIILIDDGDREDERKIIEQWKQQFNFSIVQRIPTEKGAFILCLIKLPPDVS